MTVSGYATNPVYKESAFVAPLLSWESLKMRLKPPITRHWSNTTRSMVQQLDFLRNLCYAACSQLEGRAWGEQYSSSQFRMASSCSFYSTFNVTESSQKAFLVLIIFPKKVLVLLCYVRSRDFVEYEGLVFWKPIAATRQEI